ncbi:MAG: hypothetical protein R6V83_03760 [Candidatus Thorarchaeota archaeon]
MASAAGRITKLVTMIGITFLLVSFIPSGSFGPGSFVDYGTYEGTVFGAVGNIHVNISTYNSSGLQVYVLDYDDLTSALENGSLEGTDPLMSIEVLSNYSGIIEIPHPGLYAILFTPTYNETVYWDVQISRPLPHTGAFHVGLVVTALGIAGMILLKVEGHLRIPDLQR